MPDYVGAWERVSVEGKLSRDDFVALLQMKPELIVLGAAQRQFVSHAELMRLVAGLGVAVELMELGAACRTYNILCHEERRVLAAFV